MVKYSLVSDKILEGVLDSRDDTVPEYGELLLAQYECFLKHLVDISEGDVVLSARLELVLDLFKVFFRRRLAQPVDFIHSLGEMRKKNTLHGLHSARTPSSSSCSGARESREYLGSRDGLGSWEADSPPLRSAENG